MSGSEPAMSTPHPSIVGSAAQLVIERLPQSQAAEAYRRLRTSLLMSSGGDLLHTVLVTGTIGQEGQSATVANLAVAIAQADYTVLMIDCNMEHPQLHTLFNLPNEQGLTSLLDDQAAPAFAIDGVPGLHVLPSGPAPTHKNDVLVSQRMETLLEELGEGRDIVLLDAPPITDVSAVGVLAQRSDGVLLVCRVGVTMRPDLRQARQLLDRLSARVLGVVLNEEA